MPNETWREKLQIGKETTYGTAVAATRIVYASDISITRDRESRPHRFATGTRERVRAHTLGAVQSGGSLKMDVSADTMLEFLELAFGAATISTPAGGTDTRQHLFKPLSTVPSATVERDDGARVRKATGVRVAKITIEGQVNGPNEVTFELFNKDYSTLSALTAALSEYVPTFMEGWETGLYIDTFGGTAGTTKIGGTLIKWTIVLDFMLGRKYTADNTLAMNSVVLGEVDATAQLLFEAGSAQVATELTNWEAETNRLVRIEFGMNEQIEASPTNEVQTLTITGTPTGGSVTLTFKGQSIVMPYNATVAQAQALFDACLAIGENGIVVSGAGALPGNVHTYTFSNQLGGLNVPALVVATNGLTGGSTPAGAIATTTPGVGYKRAVFVDLPGAWSAVDFNQEDGGTRVYQLDLQTVYDTTNAFQAQVICHTSRTAGF